MPPSSSRIPPTSWPSAPPPHRASLPMHAATLPPSPTHPIHTSMTAPLMARPGTFKGLLQLLVLLVLSVVDRPHFLELHVPLQALLVLVLPQLLHELLGEAQFVAQPLHLLRNPAAAQSPVLPNACPTSSTTAMGQSWAWSAPHAKLICSTPSPPKRGSIDAPPKILPSPGGDPDPKFGRK